MSWLLLLLLLLLLVVVVLLLFVCSSVNVHFSKKWLQSASAQPPLVTDFAMPVARRPAGLRHPAVMMRRRLGTKQRLLLLALPLALLLFSCGVRPAAAATKEEEEALFGNLDLDDDDDGLASGLGGADVDDGGSGGGGGDGEYDDLEEYSFESPEAVHEAWKSALDEFKEQSQEVQNEIRDKVRAMQKLVDKKEMTKEELQAQREALEKEAEEKLGIPLSCQHGRQSCLHDEKSPLKARAEKEAKAHMSLRDRTQRSAVNVALLMPSLGMPDVPIGALPQPPSDAAPEERAAADRALEAGRLGELDPEAFALLSPSMQSYVSSVAVVREVQNGAIVNTGALPFNITQWEELAEASRDRKDKRTYGHDEVGRILPPPPLLCLLACLLACLPACLLACLPACLLACLLAYLPACLLACLPCLPAFLLSCFPACLLACWLACLACLLACSAACLLASLLRGGGAGGRVG